MTTITKEFTKEQLIAKAQEQIAFCRDTKITGEGRTHVNQCSSLFEIALAALTAEPVAWTDAEELRDLRTVGFCEMFTVEPVSKDADMYRVIPLYTAPPAPVSVPDGLKQAVEFYEQAKQENIPVETGAWKDAVNWVLDEACRAAMLQANQRDLSQPVGPQVAEYEQIMLQAGWVMVPKTVTPEISLAINKVGQHCTCGNCSQRLWDMLLAAAPEPDQN